MALLQIQNLSFTYPDDQEKVLNDISFTVEQGDFLVLCGYSGCGKTTLLRQLKPALAPFGKKEGEILYKGNDLDKLPAEQQVAELGFVMQNPESQIVTDKVWHELAFGLESLGVPSEVIRLRVAEMASFFGIENKYYKPVSELSGGQKQILNLASIMVMQPEILLLDEPTSQLDPITASEFLQTLRRINDEFGTTIILCEHRLEDALPLANKVIVMEDGKILANKPPDKVGVVLEQQKSTMVKAMPVPVRFYLQMQQQTQIDEVCPITIREGRLFWESLPKKNIVTEVKSKPQKQQEILSVKNSWFRYGRTEDDVIKNVSVSLAERECFAIFGGNGAGKSTLLGLLSGQLEMYKGKRKSYDKTISVLPQEPKLLFAHKQVELELRNDLAKEYAIHFGLQRLFERHPYDLSVGEQQRLALAMLLGTNPQILLLDEPTKGLDSGMKQEVGDILKKQLDKGVSILMVSHDVEFCAEYADKCALLFNGEVVTQSPAREFFAGNSFYTTAANRMCRHTNPQIVTLEEAVNACQK